MKITGQVEEVLDFLTLKKDFKRLAKDNARLEAFLRAIPVEYCGWNKAGVKAISSGFCRLLGVDKIESFPDVQEALSPGDAAAVEGVFERLKEEGKSFELTVHTAGHKRVLKLLGKRGAFATGEESFDVIWVLDITNLVHAAMQTADNLSRIEKREHDLHSILNALPFPVWTRNEDLDLDWCNRSYARMVDDTPASVVADQKELPVTGARKDGSVRGLAQRALTKGGFQTDEQHIVLDGERRLFSLYETLQGAQMRTVGCAQDITQVEDIRKELDRFQKSNRSVLEQLHTAIAIFDADTKLEFYNAAYEQLWGLDGKWLNGKPRLSDILERLREQRKLPEQSDFRLFRQNWLKMFTSLMESHEEMQYLPDGKTLRMIVMPRPTGGLMVTFEDVTSRLELESSYNMLLSAQKETLDNLSEGIAVFGQDGLLKLWNPTLGALWKLAPEDMDGTPHASVLVEKMLRFFGDADRVDRKKLLLSCVFDSHPRKGRIERVDGSVLQFSVTPLPDGNILNVYIDVTDTARVEEALLAKNRALEETEKLKADFLANVSYQLRTPLSTALGFAEILDAQYFGPLNDKQKEYTAGIIASGRRLVSLIDDILDLSTIDAGYMKLDLASIDLGRLAGSVVDLTQDWARKQNLQIALDVEKKLPAVMADERRVKQVLLNLISNAINFSPGGGIITVFAENTGDGVCMGVRDTGAGIPAEDMERVFAPFEKTRNKTLIRKGGAGLGLALVKNIVELHGGTVALESQEGKGTTVSCLFKA